jgi:alpha-L-rhamnosidase
LSDERGACQVAWQVLVASSSDLLCCGRGDLWDSGRVEGEDSFNIKYQGMPLSSNSECFWKVRVWFTELTGQELVSSWSEPARWTTGLTSPADWQAQWIAAAEDADASLSNAEYPSPWLRKTFILESEPEKAVIHVNVSGYYELHVNGQKVGDDVLSPAVSVLSKRTWVVSRDVKSFLHTGKNAVGLWLGRGWHNSNIPGITNNMPRVRAQLHVTVGGKEFLTGTDSSWKTASSCYSTIGSWKWNSFGGERLDYRKMDDNWSSPSFNDSDWNAAVVCIPPEIEAVAQPCQLNRIGESLPAQRCLSLGNGRYELDFGTCLSGRIAMKLQGLNAGELVKFWYADRRHEAKGIEDGELTPAGVLKNSAGNKTFQVMSGYFHYQVFNQCDEFIAAGKDYIQLRKK